MKTATIIKLIDRITDFLIYFINESKQKDREKEREQIKEDPSEWFNDRYSDGVQHPKQPDGSKSDSESS